MLDKIVEDYLKIHPRDAANLEQLIKQLKTKQNLSDRKNYSGHIAGSGLIFSPDKKEILLIYHPTFQTWMQPGGHLEPGEEGPWITAARESKEETGVKIGLPLGDEKIPVLIESHLVPTRPPKNEPEHYHHAFWYAFIAGSKKLIMEDHVIKQAKWQKISELDDSTLAQAVQRARKLL